MILLDGNCSELVFDKPAELGQPLDSPVGDFSVLEQLADGTFQRTMTDRTVYQFNSLDRLSSITDRNGNTTVYEYDAEGRLVSITDPVGLETSFAYNAAGLVEAITDPSGRVTTLDYDSQANLIRITDPDDTARTWEYDALHHMTAEIDKRGNREETQYDFAGRAVAATRKDGTTIRIEPVQTRGLYPPSATTDPSDPPQVFAIEDAVARYIDSTGNVKQTQLDQAGQEIASMDRIGHLPTMTRDPATNLLRQMRDARGNLTQYHYDERGNIISIEDKITGFEIVPTIVWTSTQSGSWDDPANWSAGRVPGPEDEVLIDVPSIRPDYISRRRRHHR